MKQLPHRRRNLLTGEWVLVSPQRTQRPWLGEVTEVTSEKGARYDPSCNLCPGNQRATGIRNPRYIETFIFDNDFPALHPFASPGEQNALSERSNDGGRDFFVTAPEEGVCRVICFSPQHDLAISEMSTRAIASVIEAWGGQYVELGSLPYINAVTIFENRGATMGASNPHPHGQIWASASLPNELVKESSAFINSECVLCAYVAAEIKRDERLIYRNEHVAAIVPFWAVWPYEALVLPVRHLSSLADLTADERDAFATAMQQLTKRYDTLFDTPFPYSMGFHQAPTDGNPQTGWHLHAHYYPPLLRSATIRKFMVGYELLAMPQRDITPEEAAQRLRALLA